MSSLGSHAPGLWLASSSPRRRAILQALGIGFRTVTPGPDLAPAAGPTAPVAYAVANARHKALTASARVDSGLIIGCDTIVCLGNRVLGKPRGIDEARRMIELLSGRTHRVVTGVAVHDPPRRQTRAGSETSLVAFRHLDASDIEAYLASGESFDKAGAYGIQGRAARFVRSVRGSYLNVVGLPVVRLLELLRLSGWPRPPRAWSGTDAV